MTNKPFDPTKPYCRRDGKPAKIVHTFRDGRHIVVLEDPQDTETYYSIHPTGHVYRDGNNFHLDLINIPEKIEGWQNIYKGSKDFYSAGQVYPTHEEALKGADGEAFACIKVFFTEGEGLK